MELLQNNMLNIKEIMTFGIILNYADTYQRCITNNTVLLYCIIVQIYPINIAMSLLGRKLLRSSSLIEHNSRTVRQSVDNVFTCIVV